MLKITGGALRGRNLQVPPGQDTRPSGSKVRQALFNILGARIAGARLADLYCGPGTLGIEGLSRGAAWCLFVEERRAVARVLEANLAALGLEGRAKVLLADAAGPALAGQGPLEIILADPPYQRGQVARLLALCARPGLLAPGGLLVIEHAPQEPPPEQAGLELVDQRRYGQTMLSFWAPTPAQPIPERASS
ncbi:MAG: 16S rRNA (guanine(966)-N(2))-methyltransferase RsmD [Desulfarculus sp.]|nr:16S rRNA (guanine(966)-N(2))-methyltransferase RsmD [Desulfarculus sp.]